MSNLQLYYLRPQFPFLSQLGQIKVGMLKYEVDSLVQLARTDEGFPYHCPYIHWLPFSFSILYFTDSFKLMNLFLRLHYHLYFSLKDCPLSEHDEATPLISRAWTISSMRSDRRDVVR